MSWRRGTTSSSLTGFPTPSPTTRRGSRSGLEAAMVKYWTTNRQTEVIHRCVQLHGGYGYIEEYPIARMWIDSRICHIYAGANGAMKDLIARSF